MAITLELLQQIAPKTNPERLDGFVEGLHVACDKFEINTVSRLSCFLAQCAHESGEFTAVKENLNYSADGLNKIFHKYFPTLESAQSYARNPEMIANKVYANRMGNGDEQSGDGFSFCGRGLIQLTGRSNYTQFANDLGITLEEAVEYLQTYEGAAMSAAWFWWRNNLNNWADQEDMRTLTHKINGGEIGLDDRMHKFQIIKGILQQLQG